MGAVAAPPPAGPQKTLWEDEAMTTGRSMRAGEAVLGGGLIAATGYGLVLWAQTQASLGTVAALRETSIVFGAVIGAALLHEPLGRQRVIASVVVVTGVVLIV